MWGRKSQTALDAKPAEAEQGGLKEAVRQARIENAERSGVVVDLRDAELARLELLNDGLAPLFGDIPPHIELFDRAISHGDPSRLWIDVVAHVVMGRDKREYRFVQDTRFGRKILAETPDVAQMVRAITHYVANRLVERERAMASDADRDRQDPRTAPRRRGWRMLRAFLFGLLIGGAALFAALWIVASRLPH